MCTLTTIAKALRVFAVVAIGLTLAPSEVLAQAGGIRAGVSANPDQFFFGGHLDLGPVAEHLMFRPNVEAGVGDNLTTLAFNVEFAYLFPRRSRPWQVYAGGGPALNVYVRDAGGLRDGDTNTQPGFTFFAGVQHRHGFFTEVKLGAIDSPELKLVLGVTFR